MNLRYCFLYKWWANFLTWFGDIYVSFQRPKVKASDIRKLLKQIRPGDVILRKFSAYLDNYFIPGEYSHSCVYLGDGICKDMMAEGSRRVDVIDFIKDTDGFMLLRPFYPSMRDKEKAVLWASATEAKYDFFFDAIDFRIIQDGIIKEDIIPPKTPGLNMYCHEYTACALLAGGVYFEMSGPVILAQDIMRYCDKILESK